MSFGNVLEGGHVLDGNSLLTQFVDWSARHHDVLYVVAGNEDAGGIPVPTAWWAKSTGPTLTADFNDDDIVDGEDLADWKLSFGEDDGADADGDGDSDGNDFLVWQRELGMTAAVPANTPVPEPAAWMLGAVGASLLWRRRAA